MKNSSYFCFFFWNLRTSRSPNSWPFLFLSAEFCEICYSYYFYHICCLIFSPSRKNSCYFGDFFETLRTSWSPSWPFLFLSVVFCEICYSYYFYHICCSIFSPSRKNSCYFGDFFETLRTSWSPSWPFLFLSVVFC